MTYKHRVAFNADLFLTIETASPDTPTEELEAIVKDRLRELGGDYGEISETGFDVPALESIEGRIYPRKQYWTAGPVPDPEYLDDFTIENTEEAA